MSAQDLDLTACDLEPIHLPGSIQPHGVLLVVDRDSLAVTHAAGDVPGRLGVGDWHDAALGHVVGDALAGRIARLTESAGAGGFAGQMDGAEGRRFDVSVKADADRVLVEIEPAAIDPPSATVLLAALEAAALAFERTPNLKALCERAAVEFRRLTGFDRVMIYRFLDDEAGSVLAEDRDPALPTFLNHHFPGSDIPRQARALYVRNLVRSIPDIHYQPAPLVPAWAGPPLDMSDCVLRSVSPIHMQYMKNMGVAASASVSIVKDGMLWGLIACHHATPRLLTHDVRAACRALAAGLARQIKAKEEAESYRERLRLRSFEDDITALLLGAQSLDEALREVLPELLAMLDADGAAILRGGVLLHAGTCPRETDMRVLAEWLLSQGSSEPFCTDRLGERHPPSAAYRETTSGLLAVIASADEPFVLMWFRAEQVEVVNWAGNPHKPSDAPAAVLTPRASFDAWAEQVRGRSRPWSTPTVEAVAHLRNTLLEGRRTHRLRELNGRLNETLTDKEALIQQKELLLREVNHRVQNSLQLVSSFLGLQARASDSDLLKESFEEARRRLAAVALVHRRLYRADQIETIDLARYIDDLAAEMLESMGPEWRGKLTLNVAPVMLPTDRAVTLGLVLTELVINANKYAYGGAPGPIDITVEPDGSRFRLIVADHGGGRHGVGSGFGTRMMGAMVSQLSGELEHQDNKPGLRVVLTAPIAPNRAA